jgi:hypothetical protein
MLATSARGWTPLSSSFAQDVMMRIFSVAWGAALVLASGVTLSVQGVPNPPATTLENPASVAEQQPLVAANLNAPSPRFSAAGAPK